MQKNPFMLYAGQEYGEKGMDKEGFSGNDGRTTIFDYWSVDTLCRAAADKLTDEERCLAETYAKVLNIAREEKAVSEGISFDLMYVNGQYFRQYAFLRKYENELLLVVSNFDDTKASVSICIPAHAFDFLHLEEKDYKAVELLSGEDVDVSLRRDGMVRMELAARSGVVLKMKI
jgi:glycosidase